jgi:hypothetical protein
MINPGTMVSQRLIELRQVCLHPIKTPVNRVEATVSRIEAAQNLRPERLQLTLELSLQVAKGLLIPKHTKENRQDRYSKSECVAHKHLVGQSLRHLVAEI